MSKLDSAVQYLYEDISLREELTDDEAEVLLKWAEDKVTQLDNEIDDEEAFDEQFKQLRRMMKRMNKFIGKRSTSDLQEQQKLAAKFLDSAAELGITVTQAKIQQFLGAQQAQSNDGVLHSMLDMLKDEQETDIVPASSDLYAVSKGAQQQEAPTDRSELLNKLRDAGRRYSEGESDEQEEQ